MQTPSETVFLDQLSTLVRTCSPLTLKAIRNIVNSPSLADVRSVMDFISYYNVVLPPSIAHEFVLLPPGTYTHPQFGNTRLGVRRGDIAFIATESHGVVEVHVSNMTVVLDSPTPYRGSGVAPVHAPSVKKVSRRGTPCTDPMVGDRLSDEFNIKYTVTSETLPRFKDMMASGLEFKYNC